MTFGQIINKLNQRSTPLLPKNKFLRFSLILIAIFFIAYFSQQALAASNSFIDKKNAIKSGNNQEAWLDEAMGSNMISLFTGMVGDIPDEIFEENPDTSIINQYKYNPGGAFGTMNRFIATLQTPPASGIEYIAQVKDNFLGKPAYAQGVGFQGLQFLLPLWRGFRNVIYVISTIIFVVIGIMIMLRVKISPQAVITVQSAIPKLISTLILVTFSYAIAGLVIDLANFIQALIVAILFSVKGVGLTDNLFPTGGYGSGFPILSDMGNVISSIFGSFSKWFNFKHLSNPDLRDMQMLTYRAVPGWLSLMMLGGLLGSIVLGFINGGAGAVFGGSAGTWPTDLFGRFAGGAIGGLVGGILVPIILCIIVSIWLIKLYFGLLKCYFTLIFKIVLGPLEIAMGAFPNAKMGFSSWIMDVGSNMAVFPVIGIFLVLLNLLVDATSVSSYGSSGGIWSQNVWAPSLISAGGISPSILGGAIGLAGLAMLSKLPSLVPEFIFKIKPSPFGVAIGENLKGTYNNPLTRTGSQLLVKAGGDIISKGTVGGLAKVFAVAGTAAAGGGALAATGGGATVGTTDPSVNQDTQSS